MTSGSTSPDRSLVLTLDATAFEALQQTAQERGMSPADLVTNWIRERLAHEAERAKGRARSQRPAE